MTYKAVTLFGRSLTMRNEMREAMTREDRMRNHPEIHKLLCLSIDHVCQSTADLLEAESIGDCNVPIPADFFSKLMITVGRYGDFAWFIHVPRPEDLESFDVPADLLMIFNYADKLGCRYIVIEADFFSTPNPDLPVYPKENNT